MPSKCCVVGCSNRGGRDEGISFFRFPALLKRPKELEALSKKRRDAWLTTLRRTDLKTESLVYTRICSNHFISGSPADLTDITNPDWIPNKNMGYILNRTTKRKQPAKINIERHYRTIDLLKASNYSELEKLKSELDEKDKQIQKLEEEKEELVQKYEQEKLESETRQEEIVNDYEHLLKERELKMERANQQINMLKCIESLDDDDEKVKYFTGFPNSVILNEVYDFIKDDVPTSCDRISSFEAFIITLTKLRLDLPFAYLSYKFGVPQSTMTKIFQENIIILHTKIEQFVCWPDKSSLRLSIPPYLKEVLGEKFTAIVHTFEMYIETAGALPLAEWLLPSEEHSTMKYLIATSPSGAIIFVSKGYSSRCTERIMIETSGFLDHVDQGDVVLYVQGMQVNEVVSYHGKKLLIQPVNCADDAMSDVIKKARDLESVRGRVERVISLLRETYQILLNRQPITAYKTDNDEICIDYIVKACCALINLSPTAETTETGTI